MSRHWRMWRWMGLLVLLILVLGGFIVDRIALTYLTGQRRVPGRDFWDGAIRLDGHRFIARCRSLGLRVDYWVVDDPKEARRLLDLGATGIMSDDPALIAPVFDELGMRN